MTNTGTIRQGLPVYGRNGAQLGTIEAATSDGIPVTGHQVPTSALTSIGSTRANRRQWRRGK